MNEWVGIRVHMLHRYTSVPEQWEEPTPQPYKDHVCTLHSFTPSLPHPPSHSPLSHFGAIVACLGASKIIFNDNKNNNMNE